MHARPRIGAHAHRREPSAQRGSVLVDVAGAVREIPNDYVWVLAGGTPPNAFLAKVGVRLGPQDLTDACHAAAVAAAP
jgi:hypothetical protein